MNTIKISRLLDFIPNNFCWYDEIVTLEDIELAIKNKMQEINIPYDDFNFLTDSIKLKNWHISRIIYFITHPTEITPIQIDNICENGMILPIPFIEDGNHRFLASLYLKKEFIKCYYSGRIDVLEYLCGDTDKIPE